jgi:dynein heavy chain
MEDKYSNESKSQESFMKRSLGVRSKIRQGKNQQPLLNTDEIPVDSSSIMDDDGHGDSNNFMVNYSSLTKDQYRHMLHSIEFSKILPVTKHELSSDIVRTMSFDSSAFIVAQSNTERLLDAPTAFSVIDRESYCTPCDRIGRSYAYGGGGLTMANATTIAKSIINNGDTASSQSSSSSSSSSDVHHHLAATAPDAFEAPIRIMEIAMSETGKPPPKVSPPLPPRPFPSNGSPSALREDHRLIRSEIQNMRRSPRHPWQESKESKLDLNSWNPEPASDDTQGQFISKLNSKSIVELSMEERLYQKADAVKSYYKNVDRITKQGVETSSGSGHTLPIPHLTTNSLEHIINLVPPHSQFLESRQLQECLGDEIRIVQKDYCTFAAKASLNYHLKDPITALQLGVNTLHLTDNSMTDIWSKQQFKLKEWTTLRQTSINRKKLMSTFRHLTSSLCVSEKIMLELQYTWLDASLPLVWWENMHRVYMKSSYVNMLLTDVDQNNFKAQLPMRLEDFVAHIDEHGKDVREAMIEYWLVSIGTKLSETIMALPSESLTIGSSSHTNFDNNTLNISTSTSAYDGNSLVDEEDIDGENSNDGEKGDVQSISKNNNEAFAKFQKKTLSNEIKNRMTIEGIDDPRNQYSNHFDKFPRKNHAESLVDSAAVLLSRQLRSMCEKSLYALTDLFEDLKKSKSNTYSVFVVNLRIRKCVDKEVTGDFAEPVEVCLQPDCEEVKQSMHACITSMVGNSRNFPRPEQVIGPSFGGSNHIMVQNLMTTLRHKKMNESSVSMSDEIVTEVSYRINTVIDDYFVAPTKLLQKFKVIDDLLSGTEMVKVLRAIKENIDGEKSTIEGLEILHGICIDLEQMIEIIKNIVPDVCEFPMVEVRCVELKDLLIKQIKFLHNQILEAVCEENKREMVQIGQTYNDIANTLQTEPSDSAELKALQDFTNKSAVTLQDLYDTYVNSCFERIRFALNHNFRLPRDDIQIVYTTFQWPTNIKKSLERSFESQGQRKRELEELLEEDQRKLELDITDISKRVELLAENGNPQDFRKCVERITAMKKDLEVRTESAEEITERETLLEVPHTDQLPQLEEISSALEPLDRLWSNAKNFIEKSHTWSETPLHEVDPEEAERTADEMYRGFFKAVKEFDRLGESRATCKNIAENLQSQVKEFMEDSAPLMLLICNPGMRERHWTDIEGITGLFIPKDQTLTMSMMMEIGLHQYVKDIEDICVSASKEYGLQIAMNKMEKEWENMIFDTKEYRTTGTRILASIDEIQMLLDDHIVKTQAMRGSRFIKPFEKQITIWEQTLLSMQDILDNWLKMQSTWLYLEPIFSSDDIMRQMPTEGKMFRAVDNTWRVSMAQTYQEPSCVTVARRPGFLDSLIDANAKLDTIQKGLNDYLETKRLAFPRFFFLSNDELLEILAETKDPLKVQPHLKKCFDGMASLKFESNLDITACFDPIGEKLEFPYDKVNHKKINPNDSGGNVERWLIEVESIMKKSVAYTIDFSMKDYAQTDRIEWLRRWQGQVVIAVNQTRWTMETEKTLIDGPAGRGLQGYWEHLCKELMKTVAVVRGNIPKMLRKSVGSLVVMDVHNRDTIQELSELDTKSNTDFDWLAQLRYYWDDKGQSAQTGTPETVKCRMINALALYAYEYIGNQDRLVITPLTDRCYRTLMGAIHLNLGGAPEGPAGTGKTETTKDLAKAIAIQCVVTNCSDGLDYLAMAKFFKGLASSGSWACFDEFNRIQLEVLSVIAQQIMQIQLAKMKNLERFVFEGTELILKPTCCPFITMNPGYAGRAELPDNLKVLFRTVAMMVPDYAMIAEIILYSFGYTSAKPLSVKIVTTYKLCSEQLSSQSHYDYGMRAVIAVLRAAGNLKRSDGHLSEDVLVLRSIVDVNLPKFLSPDVPLFQGITSDLFPGTVVEPPDRDDMKMAFSEVCETRSLIGEDYFWEKVVQIYDMMVVRHGFMIVGMPFSGKSSAWKVLGETLGLLSERFPDDKRWSKVIPIVQNPKSITMGQLYGQFDPVSHEWTDGVLAINYRNAATNRIGNPEDRKWILFDGPVDAIWIENMNTVLDDNKKLCLMSGEIIAMTDVMSMMFEPMDLLVASPATVSRCGMIYMEPEKLGWKPLLEAWLEKWAKSGRFVKNRLEGDIRLNLFLIDIAHIQGLFDWLVEPCLCFVRKNVHEMCPTVDSNLISSLLGLFEALLSQAFLKFFNNEIGEDEEVTDPKLLKTRLQDIECSFIFALIWSIGKTGDLASQMNFSKFLTEIISNLDCIETDHPQVNNALLMRGWQKPDFAVATQVKGILSLPMPIREHFYEFSYLPEESKWKSWADMLPSYKIPDNAPYSTILVPNIYSCQFQYLLELLVPLKKHILMCGPTGTGKSVYIFDTITKHMNQEKFKPLCLGFSAKTSANMTQDIIDGKLDKRRKGVYGPPMGAQSIIFVDDLNMPEVETYGAQPPIELCRQLLDNGGWYDLKEKSWRSIIDTSMICAMGPPGGGRNGVTPRLLRHFQTFCFVEFDDQTLRRIFSTIVKSHFSMIDNKGLGFDSGVKGLSDAIVEATLETYRASMANLLPTPQKSHYTFNLRDFSRIVQGVLLCNPREGFNNYSLVRLWTHEAYRVIGDRLVEESDREWFLLHMQNMCQSKFSTNFYETFKHLDKDEKKEINVNDMRNLIIGDYMTEDEPKSYMEIQDLSELSTKMEYYLEEFNQQSRKPMDLVMFSFAIEHVSRISRILKMPGGNGLLVGVGGSGRQSVTRLANYMSGYNVFQIEISKNYTNVEWREDLKNVLRTAGTGANPLTFLFSDTQIKNETFVEDINNMLNSGEVPNIFPSDEKATICEAVRPFAKQVYGKAAVDMAPQELYAFFIQRVKQNMHIILAFSPIGNAFRDRLRKFPALINCCTIDWFTSWPSDALLAVSEKFLSTVKFESEEIREHIVNLCQEFHMDVRKLSEDFLNSLKRINYVTPTSYLELIQAFKLNLDNKRIEVSQARSRYEVGLDKLAFAGEQVNTMQAELADLQPELIRSAEATEILMGQIADKLPGVMEIREKVSAEAAVAQKEADIVGEQKDSVEADLAEAIPALEAAVAALNTIKPNDINEIKALKKPPEKIRMVCKAVCILQDIKPVRVPDPEDPSKRIMDYWGPSQTMLGNSGFLDSLINYDKDHMNPKVVAEIQRDFIENPDFNPEVIAKASKAAEGMCRWVMAMVTYDRVAKIVAPKKAALLEAEAKLKVTMDALNEKKAALKAVEDDLRQLEDQLEGAKTKKAELEAQADMCGKKIGRANDLLDGLGGEKARWGQFAKDLGEKYTKLTGDVLVSSGLLAYLGPFTAVYRQKQMQVWVQKLKDLEIPCSENPTLTSTLGDSVRIRQWNIDGLPTDSFSVDNGIIVFGARRWPLMIDPQGQANKWIRNMEKSNQLKVVKLTNSNYLRDLENAIQFGFPVLLENVGEELDPSLEPLLQKQIFKQGGVNCIRLGDSTVEYSEQFRFYITTKLRNPHYLPEVSVKVTLLNFMITPEGLQDQLLGIVVSQERPDLEEQRNKLIIESAENKRMLKEIEDKILHIMSSSSGNILEDESAIETLKGSKSLSDEIAVKQAIAEETEININQVRQSYSPVAFSSQVLFFCIADLANIEPVYQYSLSWFIALFINSIKMSEKGKDVQKRLENLDDHFTYSLYRNVCRSLLEKDKLLFSFLLTTRIYASKGKINPIEKFFLLTGGMGIENDVPNPAPEWLAQKNWDAVCLLADIEKFKTFKEDFTSHIEEWKQIYDSLTPEQDTLPGIFADRNLGLGLLCALRCIRPDKVVLGIQRYVTESMGDKFVKPPAFDLQACYADSTCQVPLVFILTQGSDPMGAVFRAGELLKTQVDPISLGQGQGPKAEKLIQRAKEKGTWVVLQNCHLAPSFMTTLEKICEELDPDEIHSGFRLWCTTYPSEIFPVTVLQNGVKMTNAPPKGVRANLLGSYGIDPIANDDFYNGADNGPAFRRLLFGLCFFHALVQERRLYGPLGWNIPYEFNESDLRISVQQLLLFLNENDFVPYKALKYTAGECNYGGRVTDDKDRRLLSCILQRFYCADILDDNHEISVSGIFKCPPDGSRENVIEFIDKYPLIAPPEVFGLHDNATLTKDNNDTVALLTSMLDTESGGGGDTSGGGPSKDEIISTVSSGIEAKLPENYDMEFAQLKYPVLWEESMNTVLCQELIKFNILLSLMKHSLNNVQKAVKGLVVMSLELEGVGNQLSINRIPDLWKKRSYPSLRPLAGYIADQQLRLKFFADWLQKKPPPVFWISGFFFTQAFLTGASQNYARKYTIPIDDVVFDFDMMKQEESQFSDGPKDGVYTHGLLLEGCRWDKESHELQESLPKILFSPAPIMHWVPYRKKDVPTYPKYSCPVYKTSDRRGVLATTGHSSNFVCFISMPSNRPEDHWVERGVAMLTQLDD